MFIKIFLFFIAIIPNISQADEYVHGYTRSNGTYVQGYYRSSPDSTVQDNYSYKGNTNPYTGQTGTDYYRNNPTSAYYGSQSGNQNSFNTNNYTYNAPTTYSPEYYHPQQAPSGIKSNLGSFDRDNSN